MDHISCVAIIRKLWPAQLEDRIREIGVIRNARIWFRAGKWRFGRIGLAIFQAGRTGIEKRQVPDIKSLDKLPEQIHGKRLWVKRRY